MISIIKSALKQIFLSVSPSQSQLQAMIKIDFKIADSRTNWMQLCFSALARTIFIIPLFAVFSYEFLLLFKEKVDLKKKIFAVFLTILILTFYYFYNNHLRNSYGSLFLNKLLPS